MESLLKLMCACRSKAVSAASTRHWRARSLFNVVDFGMNIQAATEAARFTKRDFAGCGVRCGKWNRRGPDLGASADPVAGLRWSKSSEQYG
jgi:gamma-glutamyltranspeptidase